ncbi:cobalamin biosynthesis protein [Variovorax sp. HJSM1_2]|uniref:cobalamin biosynthesis protein n=1 Tax=Variovorax sp. HJSM1_2 TaxID=3366263 RepID=UPI003BDAB428
MNANHTCIAGLGFRRAATTASLRAALHAALTNASSTCPKTPALTALATAEDKAHAPAFTQLAAELNLPILAIPLVLLASQNAAPSAAVPARYGQRSLSEASALAGAGPGAWLLARRCQAADGTATAAIAAIAESRNS